MEQVQAGDAMFYDFLRPKVAVKADLAHCLNPADREDDPEFAPTPRRRLLARKAAFKDLTEFFGRVHT